MRCDNGLAVIATPCCGGQEVVQRLVVSSPPLPVDGPAATATQVVVLALCHACAKRIAYAVARGGGEVRIFSSGKSLPRNNTVAGISFDGFVSDEVAGHPPNGGGKGA